MLEQFSLRINYIGDQTNKVPESAALPRLLYKYGIIPRGEAKVFAGAHRCKQIRIVCGVLSGQGGQCRPRSMVVGLPEKRMLFATQLVKSFNTDCTENNNALNQSFVDYQQNND